VALLFLNRSFHQQLSLTLYQASATIAELTKQLSTTQSDLAHERELGAQPDWLKRANYYRGLEGMPPTAEDPKLSDGDFKHARYLAKYWLREHHMPPGIEMHSKTMGDPWYTPEGFAAAKTSWPTPERISVTKAGGVIPIYPGNLGGESAIDEWMSGPFHRVSILYPGQRLLGYGQYCEAGICAAALSAQGVPTFGADPAPIMFPASGSSVTLTTFRNEWPDPLTSCPGYKWPTGLPITLQFYGRVAPRLSAYSVTRFGTSVETCGFDAFSYVGGDTATQSHARDLLKRMGVIVLVPRPAFVSGDEYTVSITANNQVYKWHFAVR
jgi:hypothetical protein